MILITGGGGYLGTELVRRLVTSYPRVLRVLDRFSWGTQPLAAVYHPRLEIVAGDLRDSRVVREALRGVEKVVHLAAIVGYPACDAAPEDAETTNVEGTRILCQEAEGRPIVFASTGSCYGRVEGLATEETPLSPLTRYGRTKAEGEKLVLEAGGTVCRLATLYGLSPRMRWDLLPNTFAKAGVAGEIRVFDAEARRTFLHVQDAARALASVVAGPEPGQIFNLGTEKLNLTKGQVAEKVRGLTGCRILPVEGHDPDERDYAISYEKLRIRYPYVEIPGTLQLDPVVAFARIWR